MAKFRNIPSEVRRKKLAYAITLLATITLEGDASAVGGKENERCKG